MDYNLQQQLMMNGMMLVKDTDDGDSQASSRKSRDPSRSRKRHRHRRHRSRSGGRRRSKSRRGSKDRDRKRRSHHNSGLSVLPDDEGHEEDEDGDHEMPDADWQCGVCSNLNSVQREECFRCSATFSQSKRTSPTCELSVRHAPDSLHEDDVVQAIRSAVSGVGENVEIVKAVRRRSTIYVRLETARHATMVLVACRCHITCEGSEHLIMFSSDNYTRPSSRHNTAVVGGKVGEQQQQQEAPPPGMPRDLWPQHWKQPAEFGGAEEEKSYLALMSEHWQHLSAAQKSYYDGRIALALQSRKPQQAEANTLPSSSQQPQSQAAGTTAAAAARPPAPAPSSSLEDIKRRLAEKKNAMKSAEGQAAPVSPSSTTTAAVNSAAPSKNPEKSSADTISQLKQRLAMKKAQLPQQQQQQQQQQQSADQQTTAQAKSQTEQQEPTTTGAIALYGGFPIPPCVDPSKMLASPMMLRCVPSMTVERLVPPAARTW